MLHGYRSGPNIIKQLRSNKFNTKKDYEDYHNSPTEQNAYYQETVHLFDDWIIELNRNNENTFTISVNGKNNLDLVFDILLNGYYDYVKEILEGENLSIRDYKKIKNDNKD